MKAIIYKLIVQCVREHGGGVIAEYTANSPFPPIGKNLELLNCDPQTWDVHDQVTRILLDSEGIHCVTLLLVDSPVLDNRDRRPPAD
jgi:hypothetical protein